MISSLCLDEVRPFCSDRFYAKFRQGGMMSDGINLQRIRQAFVITPAIE